MSQLPLDQAVQRLTANEDRLDTFVNSPTGYTASGGQHVESVQEFLGRKESEIEDIAGYSMRYYGPSTSDPATRPDGSPRQNGDEYQSMPSGVRKVFQNGVWAIVAGASSNDLANAEDQTKGSSLVGFRGASVQGAIDVSLRRPRKVFGKLFNAAMAAAQVKMVPIGDSLAGAKPVHFIGMLDRRIGGAALSGVVTAGVAAGSAGYDLSLSSPVNVTVESGYDYWPTGSLSKFSNGGSAVLQAFGVNPTYSKVRVFYVQEPGAGTVNLVAAGSTVATASANNASVTLGVLEYSQAAAQTATSVTVSGTVRVLFAHAERSSQLGVDLYGAMSTGGLLLANAVASAQCRAIWQAALAAIAPDLVTFEMDDEFGTDPTSQAAWATMAGMLDAACPYADKLIIASTPRATGDSGKAASSRWLRGQVAARGVDYLFFDGYGLMGSYAQMTAIFGADDGVHPAYAAQAFASEALWCGLGLDGAYLGYVPRAINDRGTPSVLARNTKMGSQAGSEVSFETDASFGYDWTVKFPRMVTFTKTTGGDGVVAQFSGNTGVFPNILPAGWKWGSAADTRSVDFSSAGGFNQLRFRDSGNTHGGQEVFVGNIVLGSYAKASLPTANNRTGALIYVSDGAIGGGGCMAYSRGDGQYTWRRVSDDSVVS